MESNTTFPENGERELPPKYGNVVVPFPVSFVTDANASISVNIGELETMK